MKRIVHLMGLTAVLLLGLIGMRSEAQQAPPSGGPLTTLVNDPLYAANFGSVERTTAVAIDAAVASLRAGPCGEGCSSASLNTLFGLLTDMQANANSVLFGNGGPGSWRQLLSF